MANWEFIDNYEHGYHKVSVNSRVRKSIPTWRSPIISRYYDSYDGCSFCSVVVSLLVRQPETRYKGFWRHLFGMGGVILVLCDNPHNQTSKTYAAEIFRGLDSGIYSSCSLPIKNCALRRKSSKHLISQIATPLFLSDQPLFLEQLHTFAAAILYDLKQHRFWP